MGFQLPGFEQGRSYTPREIWFSGQNQEYQPGGVILDYTKTLDASNGLSAAFPNGQWNYEIRAGWPVGRYTAIPTLYRLCTRTTCVAASGFIPGSSYSSSVSSGASGSANANIYVAHAEMYIVGDVVTVGANAAQAITAINYLTNMLTFATPIACAAGDVVKCTDGSAVMVGFLPEFSKLKNVDNTVPLNKSSKMAVAGELAYEFLLGDIAAILADPLALWSGFRVFQAGQRIK